MGLARICLVDDEVITRMDVREMLADAGYEVVGEGSDGFAAVELARTKRPDLTVLDVKMPGLDGVEAAKIIAGEQLGPVLLLTAFTYRNIINRAQNVGVMGYLVKPVREEDLLAAIPVAISRYRELQKLKSQYARLHGEIEDRKVLERAKGVLMVRLNISEAESHRRLQEWSMRRSLDIVKIARDVLNEKVF